MSRIPLVATVVGALLVGGATTGVTFASWSNQRPLHANGVQSGRLSFTATSPGAVAVDQTAGSTADSTFVLDDTSTGKNNQQRITASVAGTPAGITARVGTSCLTATTASVAVDTTPSSANQSLCVRVTVSNQPTTAVSGSVTVSISGAQRPAGWSTPLTTVSVPVTVNTGMTLTCAGSPANNTVRIEWTPTPGGGPYTVGWSSSPTGPFTQNVQGSLFVTFADYSWTGNVTRYFGVSTMLSSPTMSSNVLKVTRNSSRDFTCEPM